MSREQNIIIETNPEEKRIDSQTNKEENNEGYEKPDPRRDQMASPATAEDEVVSGDSFGHCSFGFS